MLLSEILSQLNQELSDSFNLIRFVLLTFWSAFNIAISMSATYGSLLTFKIFFLFSPFVLTHECGVNSYYFHYFQRDVLLSH